MIPRVRPVITPLERARAKRKRVKSGLSSKMMLGGENVDEGKKPVECKSESGVAGVAAPACGTNAAELPTLIDGRYLLGDKIWHSPTHRKCVDTITGLHYLCQVTCREPDVTKLPSFVAHIRLEGHSGVNPIRKIVVDAANTYVLYRAWGPKLDGPHDLQGLLQSRRRLSEAHCRQYFRQIATLVRDAHDVGVVLRDLKLRKFVFKDFRRMRLKSIAETDLNAAGFDIGEGVAHADSCVGTTDA